MTMNFTQGITIGRNRDKERLINLLAAYGIREPILSAFEKIPRERFVDPKMVNVAYEDRALPIGKGQTISQPSLVAVMIQALDLRGGEKVLEIGTGSGFQTALLSNLAREVYSIERIESLANQAKEKIRGLGLRNVKILIGDGSEGVPQYAPFDTIIVSAAFKKVPTPLIKQLKPGGRIVMPIGHQDYQEVILYKKTGGQLRQVRKISPVRFVPLVGKYGWGVK